MRHDEIFYNKDMIYAMNDAIDENLCIPTELIPRCPQCGAELEPWVRGYTFLEGEKYRDEYRKINEFLQWNRGAQFFFRDYSCKLEVLICSHDVIVFPCQQCHQVIVRFSCLTFVFHVAHSGQERPAGLGRGGKSTMLFDTQSKNASHLLEKIETADAILVGALSFSSGTTRVNWKS